MTVKEKKKDDIGLNLKYEGKLTFTLSVRGLGKIILLARPRLWP